ncbi:MAG TPA: PEP-CTERM sorting domain-containing protein [Burkholderiaceae bacterium]|nr:PEP-CTERM sorting domain-containing protein [Burkholderiaceae bacterium]
MKPISRLLATAAALAVTQSVMAVTLPANTYVSLPGTTVAAEPQLAGVVLEDQVQAFSFNNGSGIVSGTVQSRVVRSSVDGTLDFYWRVISDRSSAGDIGSFRLGNFVAPEYNANWRSDGLGNVAPDAAYHFGAPLVGYVNYIFGHTQGDPYLTPGSESYFMFLDTSATSYGKTALYDLTDPGQGNITTSYATFAPAVPEPSSYAMLLLGLAGVGLAAARRRS